MPPTAARSSRPIDRGDELELDIVALGDGPDGVGKIDDYVVFVPGTLPGERARVRITSAARKFGRGELLELLTVADDRVPAPCPHFGICGGCHRQHQYYPAQLEDKRARLQRAMNFALGADAPQVGAMLGAVPSLGQRHKVALHLRNSPDKSLQACFHRVRSADLVWVHECPTSDPLAWDLAMRAVELLHELPHGAWDPDFAPKDLLRSVLVRTTTTGDAHLIFVAREPFIPGLDRIVRDLHDAGAVTIGVNHNHGEFSQLLGPRTTIVSGPERIGEKIGDITYLLSPDAFFQTSPQAAGHLIDGVVGWLQPTARDLVADLYCGSGLLTLPLARRAHSALGIELRRDATLDAEVAAALNKIDNASFRSGPVERWLARCGGELPAPHLVAVDPPRAGLDAAVIAELARLRPRRIAYVSCDVASLQRDLGALRDAGFATVAVTPIDMFPHTSHIEALACLAALR